MKKLFSVLLMGVFIMTSMSLFTSCKDYDDEINAAKEDISKLRTELTTVKSALETELNSQKSTFETQIAAVKKELQAAIDKKADESTVSGLQTKLKDLETDFAAKMAVLTTQIETANNALSQLDQKADKSTVDGVLADLAALTGKLSDETKAREAVEANLRIQIEALEKLRNELTDADYQAQINQLIVLCQSFETSEDAGAMKEDMKKLQQEISSFNAEIDALNVLIERMLNSIALVPYLYVDGIEAIEFLSLEYTPLEGGKNILISNGETEATYRLNPTTVEEDGIDKTGIEFIAARAETRGADILSKSDNPVAFDKVKEFKNGLMTVTLKKTKTESLNLANNKIYIVSLKVPRNAAKYEAADIYSEHSRLVETTVTPQIASLPWNVNGWSDNSSRADQPDFKLTRPHHYSSEADIYASRVDASKWALVAKEVYYANSFDLNTIVTGCVDKKAGTHSEITKERLATFGLEFRYEIPSKVYNNGAPNSTNQQEFASVTQEGIITSKTPAGLTDNKAVIGKEPIVKVILYDKNNNKTVDVRYLKIKWVDKAEEYLPDVELKEKTSEATLIPCDPGTVKADYLWREFVNEVYAKAQIDGLSQNKFKEIYGDNPTISATGWTTNWNPKSDTSAPSTGTTYQVPVWVSTTNENGDALVGNWSLTADDIQTVYCNSASDTKTFTAKVFFKSSDRTKYPNLWFNWKFTIKLPTLPSIVGFYDQYWLDGKSGQEHDVLPVQYNTQAQTLPYCVFNNNLMNAFAYNQNPSQPRFIVKDVPSCGTWDLQFSYDQDPISLNGKTYTYGPNYTATTGTLGGPWKSKGQWTHTMRDDFANFVAYKYMRKSSTPWDQALQMNWDDGHQSWCGNPEHYQAYLFADHHVPANQILLNPLGQGNVVDANGTIRPERTHTKPINMTVWATLNNYNYIPVHNYKIYLVEPLRINTKDMLGEFKEGVVSGSVVDFSQTFTFDDFRGYLVANTPASPTAPEQKRYTQELYKYYEIEDVDIDPNAIRYTFKVMGGSVVVDNTLNYNNSMTKDDLYRLTNGNVDFTMTVLPNYKLMFKNNGGSNVEQEVYVWIPVTVKYGFGTLTANMKAVIKP